MLLHTHLKTDYLAPLRTRHLPHSVFRTCVVEELKVCFILGVLVRLGFAEALGLPVMVLVQHGLECLICGFRKHALLLQDRQNTHRLERKQKCLNI